MKKIIAVIAFLFSMGTAYANEPVALTDGQMDNVSAGGYAFANSLANAYGALYAATSTLNHTTVTVMLVQPIQGGQITTDLATSSSSSQSSAY
jgi:hypothetical protein